MYVCMYVCIAVLPQVISGVISGITALAHLTQHGKSRHQRTSLLSSAVKYTPGAAVLPGGWCCRSGFFSAHLLAGLLFQAR